MNLTDPPVAELALAVKTGDIAEVERLLAGHPGLATEHFTGRKGGTKTALHFVTDWPGYFPGGPRIATILLAAGADIDARTTGRPGETPLHWAASTDDLDVAEVLVDAGADLGVPNGSIGTPLANAIGYGCWHVARLLVARGARVDELWQAAAMGMLSRVEELLAAGATADDINHGFWQACHGGQRRAAERLLNAGADLAYSPDYASGETAAQSVAGLDTRRQTMATWLSERTGTPSGS
jgi:ankyrin repeat protein